MSQGIQGATDYAVPGSTDGRNIDAALGTLIGEGSVQKGGGNLADETGIQPRVYEGALAIADRTDPTYYGRPVVRKAPWSWTIPFYYYIGGTAGGAAVLGAAATALNRNENTTLISRTRWFSVAGSAVSAVLLVYDLGKPARFLYMLRVFRPTSPMNMGAWILTGFSSLCGISAITSNAPAPLQAVGDTIALGAGAFGLMLSGYTGVLVTNTVLPTWQRSYRMLPLLFLASAAASASSLLEFFTWNKKEARAIAMFGTLGKLADVGCSYLVQQQVQSIPEAARPLKDGFSGFLWKAGKALTATSLVLTFVTGSSRRKSAWIGALGTAGALCLRFGIHYAGQRSAENPRATFHQQRSGQGAFAVTGKAAVTGPQDRRAVVNR